MGLILVAYNRWGQKHIFDVRTNRLNVFSFMHIDDVFEKINQEGSRSFLFFYTTWEVHCLYPLFHLHFSYDISHSHKKLTPDKKQTTTTNNPYHDKYRNCPIPSMHHILELIWTETRLKQEVVFPYWPLDYFIWLIGSHQSRVKLLAFSSGFLSCTTLPILSQHTILSS